MAASQVAHPNQSTVLAGATAIDADRQPIEVRDGAVTEFGEKFTDVRDAPNPSLTCDWVSNQNLDAAEVALNIGEPCFHCAGHYIAFRKGQGIFEIMAMALDGVAVEVFPTVQMAKLDAVDNTA